ncbi:Mu-like prophage protein gp29 [Salmonella enterica subsp. enterica serovar Typhi]|nr:Mu-like prophage protein gp29 [Salmonella enterica subsp. enterica serovar Typhi]CIN30717.1 Mu-like prophage protein gp29 [Salmonella enterica subsp. enterica serovar Typhi]
MARGIWVSPDEFVAFSEPQKSLTAQIASRSRAIDFYGLGMYLPNPDPILKAQGRDIRIYRELRTDPLVGGCIRRRKAALKSLERGLERGHASARVFRFIRDMLDDLDLSRIIGEMSDAVLYGYQPCEIMWGRSVRAWAVTDIVGNRLSGFSLIRTTACASGRVMRVWRVSCCHRQNSWCRHRMPRMTILTVSRTCPCASGRSPSRKAG